MDICNDCKHNLNGFCNYYKAKVSTLDMVKCPSYRKRNIRVIKNKIKKKSIKQEKKLADDIGATLIPQSGAQDTSPNDMVKGKYIIESKATEKDRITLKQEWLKALKMSPMNHGKIPVMFLEFANRERYVILDAEDFKFIIGEEDGN